MSKRVEIVAFAKAHGPFANDAEYRAKLALHAGLVFGAGPVRRVVEGGKAYLVQDAPPAPAEAKA